MILIRITYLLLLIVLYNSNIFPQINSRLYLENANITEIKELGDELWVATYGDGVFKYSKKDNKWTNFSTKSNNLDNLLNF